MNRKDDPGRRHHNRVANVFQGKFGVAVNAVRRVGAPALIQANNAFLLINEMTVPG